MPSQHDSPTRADLILMGYRFTTVEIVYRLPDYPSLLQSFILQQLDLAPRYPELCKFLAFWEKSIEGPLHSVRVDATALITPKETRVGTLYELPITGSLVLN